MINWIFYYILIGSNAVYPITDRMGSKETLVVKAGHPRSTISVDDCFFTVLCFQTKVNRGIGIKISIILYKC